MNGVEYIAKILKAEGVQWISCFPSNPLISAVAKEGIRPIAFRHERGAVMAADGFSRVMNRQGFGVVAVQSQAGAENSLGGIAQAFADNIPILVFLGGNSLNQLSVKPNFNAVQRYQGWVKHIEAIYDPSQVGDVMRRAFHALRNGAPGPVVIELISDVCIRSVSEEAQNYTSPRLTRQIPEPLEIEATADALLASKTPMIWAGAGVLFSGSSDALKELSQLTSIPVFCTMPGKSGFDERDPLSLGSGCGTTTQMAHEWLKYSDVILALGSSLTRSPYAQAIPKGKILIQNTNNPDDINKNEPIPVSYTHLTLPTSDLV